MRKTAWALVDSLRDFAKLIIILWYTQVFIEINMSFRNFSLKATEIILTKGYLQYKKIYNWRVSEMEHENVIKVFEYSY